MPLTKNIVTHYGADATGATDSWSTPALGGFQQFLADAQAVGTDLVTLTMPAGTYICTTQTFDENQRGWFYNIKNLYVSAAGATISNNGSEDFNVRLNSFGVSFDGQNDTARLASVSAGASSVTLLNIADASKFSANSWTLICGGSLQAAGQPQVWQFYEYVYITGISGTTITLSAPLVNTYLSTWPCYNDGSGGGPDEAGPASLIVLNPSWDVVQVYDGCTLTNQPNQVICDGRDITYKNVTCLDTSGGLIPSMNMSVTYDGCNIPNTGELEIDKDIGTMTVHNSTIAGFLFQSPSPKVLNITGGSVIGSCTGLGQDNYISDSTITTLWPGCTVSGRTNRLTISNSTISSFGYRGVLDKGKLDDSGINSAYSISGGTLSTSNSLFTTGGGISPRWQIPDTYLSWAGAVNSFGMFKTGAVTNGSTVSTATDWPNGFPPASIYTGGAIWLRIHPCPILYCSGSTGSSYAGQIVDMSQPGAQGRPLFSYSKRSYNYSASQTFDIELWGKLDFFKFTVDSAYGGVNLPAQYNFQAYTRKPDGTSATYNAIINLAIAGTRTVTTSGPINPQSGDSFDTWPDANTWVVECVSLPMTNGGAPLQITVELQLDQGIPLPEEEVSAHVYRSIEIHGSTYRDA